MSTAMSNSPATIDAPGVSATQPPIEEIRPGLIKDPVTGKPKFAKGNKLSKGSSAMNSRSLKLRAALLTAVTVEDIQEIMESLVEAAKNGNITAAREVLDRTIGKADESMVAKKLEELEERFLANEEEAE